MKTGISVVIITIVASMAAQEAAQTMPQKRSITEKDLFDFIWVANPQV